MKRVGFAVLLACAALAAPAFAAPRIVLGLHFGVPFYWYGPPYYAPYYYPPYYYPPPAVYYPPSVVYAPPAESAPPPAAAQYWYYCAQSQSYYPYVRECPGGWQRVSPVPPQ